jgi:SAM-dependent methyltransferase
VKSESDRSARQPPDTDTYAHKLRLSDSLREPAIRSAIRALRLRRGSRGLDAGCGIGSHTLLLAETVTPEGHVTGLDLSPRFLAHAREAAEKSNLSRCVSFREGNVSNLPFEDDSFDWAWSVDCVGFIPAQPVSLLKELARVVKPGGSVAILLWSSQQLLPGYPVLEARLNATSQGIAPFARGSRPESHFLRALGWFRDAGLEGAAAQPFAGDIHVPLSDDVREALLSLLEMRWGEPRSELSPEDWEEYQRLCRPESPDFILNLSEYYAFFTYSMFHGKVGR